MSDFLASEEGLSGLLDGFERGTWPIAEWKHKHHLAVAVCYLTDGRGSVMDRLRTNIRSYNASQGGENTEDRGYHETVTRFWAEMVDLYLGTLAAGLPRIELTRQVVGRFEAERDLFREYYDFDVVKSREARAAWIPPSRPFTLDRRS